MMTDALSTDDRLEVPLLKAESIKLRVPPTVVPEDNSFKSVSRRDSKEFVAVQLMAGVTWLDVDGEVLCFDGVRYFPSWDADDHLHDDVWDAYVDWSRAEESRERPADLPDSHLASRTTVRELAEGLASGRVTPLASASDRLR